MGDKALEVYTEIFSFEVRSPAIGVGGMLGEKHLGLLGLSQGLSLIGAIYLSGDIGLFRGVEVGFLALA